MNALNFDKSPIVTIGKVTFQQSENVKWNNHKYSKSWHRKFGGVKEVSDRKITISKPDARVKGGIKILAVVEFGAWRGDVLLQAIKQSGVFAEPKSTAPLSVRLDKFYDAKPVRVIGKITIWERTLLGEHVDYCAALNKVTFHAGTTRDCIKGIHAKIKAAAKKINSPITYQLCKDLGFCDAGIKAFCNAFGLSIKDSFSPAEIEKLVIANREKAAPFGSELRAVAKALGYQTAI